MKKVLTLVSFVFFATAFANAQQSKLQEVVKQAIQQAATNVSSNAGVEERNGVLQFTLSESVVNDATGASGTYHADYRCKVYALDQNWYIAAGTCGKSYAKGRVHENDNEYDSYSRHGLKLYYTDGTAVEYKKNDHVTLIRKIEGQSDLSAPYVNVLATTPQKLLTLTGEGYTLKINTSRYGLDAIRSREIRPKSIDGNTFSLREGMFDLSGSATDPLFAIAPNDNVFLAASNNSEMTYAFYDSDKIPHFDEAHGDHFNKWFSLTEDDLKFIKQTVSAYEGDWDRIKTRLFLDQTETPYEK